MIPKNDPCLQCRCFYGRELCQTQKCPPPPGPSCVAEKVQGHCCPRYTCRAPEEVVKPTSGQPAGQQVGDNSGRRGPQYVTMSNKSGLSGQNGVDVVIEDSRPITTAQHDQAIRTRGPTVGTNVPNPNFPKLQPESSGQLAGPFPPHPLSSQPSNAVHFPPKAVSTNQPDSAEGDFKFPTNEPQPPPRSEPPSTTSPPRPQPLPQGPPAVPFGPFMQPANNNRQALPQGIHLFNRLPLNQQSLAGGPAKPWSVPAFGLRPHIGPLNQPSHMLPVAIQNQLIKQNAPHPSNFVTNMDTNSVASSPLPPKVRPQQSNLITPVASSTLPPTTAEKELLESVMNAVSWAVSSNSLPTVSRKHND